MFWKMQCALALLAVLLVSNSGAQRLEKRKSSSHTVPVSADVKKAIDFECPEEFGYYPHPSDCSQYYVCVFGGALLESCTGGLMYSHELQTCDWPRNVGCSAGEVADTPRIQQQSQPQHVPVQVSRAPLSQRVSSPQPQPQSQRIRVQAQPPPPPRPSPNPVVTSRGQPTHINQHEIVKLNNFQQQLYADVDEQLPPAEELENDGQQRVLRGQPSSLGAVQRDRDGLSPNTIRQGKVGTFSFGTAIDRDEILQNYSESPTTSDLTDFIQNWTEPSNSIDTTNNSNKGNARNKRDTAQERADDDRDKRQVRFARVQQSNGGNNNVNQRWNEQKKKNNEYVQYPNSQHNSGPFKPSAQISDGFSPLTGSAINLQKTPISTQYSSHSTNDGIFKPIPSDSAKQYSSNVGNYNSYSSTPNYAFYTLNPKDTKSHFAHSTTAAPIYKENFQYFSLKPESITKSPPISSLKSSPQSPFAALSGGFYNNKPETSIRHNSKIKSPSLQSFSNQQPISLQYDYEVGPKKHQANSQQFFVSTQSPNDVSIYKNQQKPSRLPPVRTKSTNKEKVQQQHNRPTANYESNRGTNRINHSRDRKVRPDQHHEYTNTNPKYTNEDSDDADDDEEEEEGDDEEDPEQEVVDDKNKNSSTDNKQNVDVDEIKPHFPEPPEHFTKSVNKYENIVNPFADPNFDFDSFISKVRSTHLSNAGIKASPKPNSNYKEDATRPKNPITKVRAEFLDHHKYEGMSTPRPFSSSSVSWPGVSGSQKTITPKPALVNEEYYDGEEYYEDDEIPVSEKNKIKPAHRPTKNTLLTPVSSSFKKPSNHQSSYNNNYSNSLSKPPAQHQTFSHSGNLYEQELRRPLDHKTNQRLPNYQTFPQSSIGSNNVQSFNDNKYISSTSSKPVFHSSFKVSPTLGYETVTQQFLNKIKPNSVHQSSQGNFQPIYNSNKRPSTVSDYKTSSKYTENKGYRQSTTPAPKKRRPIPKPSPEMNDYYYDEEDDAYYFEPPVKSKFMPSTEIKPQRPPIAQNYEEYDDLDFKENKKHKPNNLRRPINNNETFDEDESEEDDNHKNNEAQLKRPFKPAPTHQSTTDNAYFKHPAKNVKVQPTKTSILIPVKFDSHNFHMLENTRPAQVSQNLIKRPEITNYEVLHPISTKLPSIAHKPRYLNQTTLRPYTVRHRLAKPTSTLSTYADLRYGPTKQTSLKQHLRATQSIPFTSTTYKQPLLVSTTLKTDSENQETRLTEPDDNAPNRVEPVVSSSPSYTRQKGSGGRALFNTTSLQYDHQPYDPYYTLYDEEQELYKDADYAQQYNSASQRPSAQQPFRSTPSPSSPSPTPSTQHYTPSQAVYTQQASAEDYDDALINPDINDSQYQQQPVRSSTTSNLDLINELGFGLSTFGAILRTSISPRVVPTASTTTTTTTTTTYSPPVTRAPIIQRSTTSDNLKGNLDPSTERPKQPVVQNNRYTADSLNSQRLLLQTRRKQLRLLQNHLTSQEVQASEQISQSTEYNSESIEHNSVFTQQHTSESIQHNPQPTETTIPKTQSKQTSAIETTTQSTSTKPLVEQSLEKITTERSEPSVPEVVSNNSLPSLPGVSNHPFKNPPNASRFLSLTTGFSFKKDSDDNSNEPSYTLRVYESPAKIAIPDKLTPTASDYNDVHLPENKSPKVSYKVGDLVVENVEESSKTENKENIQEIPNVIVSSERPRPITFVIENLPKPGEKPIVIQLKSHTGSRSRGPRIEPQDIVPIYNRPSNRAFNAPSQDNFIYFKPSPHSPKEISLINHTIPDSNNNNYNNKHRVLKTVIKRPSATTSESVADSNQSNVSNSSGESDTDISQFKQSSKSNLSKEINDLVSKDIIPPKRNNIETLPNTLQRRKAFREVFNAKTESSLSSHPNVSPFKTLENLLKDERFDRTTPTNRYQNNIIGTTHDPRRTNGRRNNGANQKLQSSDRQIKDSIVSPKVRSRETLLRRTTTTPTSIDRNSQHSVLSNPIAQNFIQNIYKLSSFNSKQDTSTYVLSDETIKPVANSDTELDESDRKPDNDQKLLSIEADYEKEDKTNVNNEQPPAVIDSFDKEIIYSNEQGGVSQNSNDYESIELFDDKELQSASKHRNVVQNYNKENSNLKDTPQQYQKDINYDTSSEKDLRQTRRYKNVIRNYEKEAYEPKVNYEIPQNNEDNKLKKYTNENGDEKEEIAVSDKYPNKSRGRERFSYKSNSDEVPKNVYRYDSYNTKEKKIEPLDSYETIKDEPITEYDSDKYYKNYSEESNENKYTDNDEKAINTPNQYKENSYEVKFESKADPPNNKEENYDSNTRLASKYPISEEKIEPKAEQRINSQSYGKNIYENIQEKGGETLGRYGQIQENNEPIIDKDVKKHGARYETKVEIPIVLNINEYSAESDEYEEYEENEPNDKIYTVQLSNYEKPTTNPPQTRPTTTIQSPTTNPITEMLWNRVAQRNRITITEEPVLPTHSPSLEPFSSSEPLWNKVSNRLTVTKTPYRSRGGSLASDSENSYEYQPTDTFNDVEKNVDDYNFKINRYYDESRRTTEKDQTYPTLLPTAPPHASTAITSTPVPVKVISTTSQTTPMSFKPAKSFTKSNTFRPSSTITPSPSTTPSGRMLRVNNDIKSKALASQRSYPSNKCTENSLLNKCNNDNSLQRTNTRGRGSAHYSTASDGEPIVNANRGTPPTPNRGRPTLKPSTSIVSKAQEFVDIYRFPPRRPDNVYPTPQVDKTAAKCRKDVCLLPDCSCGGKDIPGNLPVEEVPQIVLITFDDAVNDLNKATYSELFEQGRKNPNGCPISGTFYVSHEWTDYSQVQNLYADGHEMASHTVSHSFGEQFSQKKWNREVGGQREILSAYGGVKLEDVRGMRAPFLSVGGNKMFKMLYDSNFTYDSSMPVYENRPPSWPYTLDYKLFHDCMIPPCPTKSYPGVWEVPMVMWQDLNGGRCSMGDACSNPPNAEGVYKMLLKNFDRHYTTNRAPFGLFYHAAWFTQPHHKEGFIMFLDTINAMKDVFLVTNWQAIQWVRDPTPLSRINSFQPFHCNYQDRPKRCNNPKVCNLWHKSGVRYMRTCQPCPDIYPWTGKTGIRSSRIDNEIEE